MALQTMNYKLAMAAGQDAANAQMRKAGRKAWNEDDYNLSVATVERLIGTPEQYFAALSVATVQ